MIWLLEINLFSNSYIDFFLWDSYDECINLNLSFLKNLLFLLNILEKVNKFFLLLLFLKIENLSFFWILLLYSSTNSIKLILLGDNSSSLLDDDLNVFPINSGP